MSHYPEQREPLKSATQVPCVILADDEAKADDNQATKRSLKIPANCLCNLIVPCTAVLQRSLT